MVKNSLIFKIFVRFLKEHNFFSEFKQLKKINYFNNLDSIINIRKCYLYYFFPLEIINNIDSYEKIRKFISSHKISKDFCNLIEECAKEYCNKFLIKENIKEKFITNLYEAQFLNKDKGTSKFNIKKDGDKILNEYIEDIISRYTNPLIDNLFFSAFSWERTKEGYSYWREMNEKYKAYMSKNILNI